MRRETKPEAVCHSLTRRYKETGQLSCYFSVNCSDTNLPYNVFSTHLINYPFQYRIIDVVLLAAGLSVEASAVALSNREKNFLETEEVQRASITEWNASFQIRHGSREQRWSGMEGLTATWREKVK